jgi:hypothetical protein
MAYFRASVQYGDWEGTGAADDTDAGSLSLHRYLEQKGLIKPGEFLVAASLWVGENSGGKIDSVFASAYLFNGGRDFESVQKALDAITGPIPVREVEVKLTLAKFIALFKRFDVELTRRGLSLTDREYRVIEE